MSRIILLLVFAARSLTLLSQDSVRVQARPKLELNVYADLFFQWSSEKDHGPGLPTFIYNFRKFNSIRPNLALLRSNYSFNKWKASIGIMSGDYSRNNLATEPHFFQHIYEANISFRSSSKTEIQAGIFPSHIGFESAIAGENWNLSRTVLAENSPYYETGLKLNFIASQKIKLSFLLINGWQHIKDDNHSISFGTQAQIVLSPKTSLNSSTYFGKEGPDSISRFRAFHNFYLTYLKDPNNSIAFLFDMGIQQNIGTKYSNWWGAGILYQHKFCPEILAGTRIECYNDKRGIIISPYQPHGPFIFSYSVNIDYVKFKWIHWRIETRLMHANIPVFENGGPGNHKNNSLLLCTSINF